MFSQENNNRGDVYNLLWKYKGYNLKLTEKEFEKKGFNIHKRNMNVGNKKKGENTLEEFYNPRDIKKATRNDYEMLTIIKKDLFRKQQHFEGESIATDRVKYHDIQKLVSQEFE